MGDSDFDFLPLRVTKVGVNGKRSYDREGKRRLIEACLEPGVSVASMAIRAQVNTNQLWRWIKQHKVARRGDVPMDGGSAAFVSVVEVRDVHAQAQSSHPPLLEPPAATAPQLARLSARLPNGVTVELQCAGSDAALVAAMVKALGER
ncbi:IS66-like element accessory protein TnpA [Burkholderia ambifaria]|jgi:transposase|uniref:IS66-like element accessory protein TnpA n=1 Tax=Burkholderia ambifaria TaxID=152480 RepID=UPI001588985F|nr:transposase [Burkholderia ambifaria]